MSEIPKLPQPPKFMTEKEEADWWYAHRDIVEARLEAAKEAGKTKTPAEIRERELKKRSKQLRTKHATPSSATRD
jgi:hypothetical protein